MNEKESKPENAADGDDHGAETGSAASVGPFAVGLRPACSLLFMNSLLIKAREWVWLEGDPDRDHSTGLAVFGAVEIILGVLAFALAMFLIVLLAGTAPMGMKPAHFWTVASFLFFLAAWFCAVGVGSIKARRWARVLVLVGSWITIFFGTMLMALLLYLLPGVYDLLADSAVLSPSTAMTALSFSIIFYLLLQLVLPIAAICFYNLKGVQVTCERLNPAPCWSDRCPLPLFAMGFIAVLGCLSLILGASFNYVVFLFGRVLVGWQGFMIVLPISMICGYVGWGAFTRRMHAWWTAYALILLISASLMLTFSEYDMVTLYSAMGYGSEQVNGLGGLRLLSPALLTAATCVWGIMTCIYLVWVRDSFLPEHEQLEVKSYRQRKAEEDAGASPEPSRPRMRLED